MKSRIFICYLYLIPLLGMILLFAIACQIPSEVAGISSTGEIASGGPVTILFGCHKNYEALFSQYEVFARQFEEQYPGIKVEVIDIDQAWGGHNNGTLVFSENSWQQIAAAADTSCIPANPNSTQQGFVQDLTPFLEMDPDFQPEDFYPHVLESFQWAGGTWSIPHNVNFQFVFYHKAAFDAVNMGYPQPGWTWDDFLEKALVVAEREGNETKRWGFVQPKNMDFVFSLVEGHLLDSSENSPTLLFNTPPVVEAVTWYTDLHLKYQVMPFPQDPVSFQPHLLAQEGRAAMWTDVFIRSQWWWQKDLGLGVAPYPIRNAQDATTPVSVWPAYTMSAGTIHPQESWLWLSFLSRQALLDGSKMELPARRSVAETTGFWQDLDEELVPVYQFALQHSLPRNGNINKEIMTALYDAVEIVFEGNQEVTITLSEAQAEANQTLSQYTQHATPQSLAVATPVSEVAGGVTITFSPLLHPATAYDELAQTFHTIYPDITVDIHRPNNSEGFDMAQRVTAADCFQWPAVPDKQVANNVLDLSSFLATNPDFSLDDFYPTMLDDFRWQGSLWALLAETQLPVVYYNQDLFDAAAITYPQPGWDLDDFLTNAKALTQGEGEQRQYGYLPLNGDTNDFFTFLSLPGNPWLDKQNDNVLFKLNHPTVVETLKWHTALDQVHHVKPFFVEEDPAHSETVAWQKRQNLRDTGRAAMWIDTIGGNSFPVEFEGMRIGVAPLPVKQDQVVPLAVYGYYVSRHTPYPQQCWQWITFLSEQGTEVQKLPARQSVAEKALLQANVGPEAAETYLFSIDHNKERSEKLVKLWVWPAYQWLRQSYGEAASGTNPELALGESQHKADTYYACLQDNWGFSDEALQMDCAEKADPDFQWSGETSVQIVVR